MVVNGLAGMVDGLGRYYDVSLETKLELWMRNWETHLNSKPDVPAAFLSDTGYYYLDFTGILNKVVCDQRVMYWSSPFVGPRLSKLNVLKIDRVGLLPDVDKAYLKSLYDKVLTLDDYEAVSNHMYVLQYGGPRVGKNLAFCDLSGYSMYLLKGFLLTLSQKKFPSRPKSLDPNQIHVLKVDSELVKYRRKINLKLQSIQKVGVPFTMLKNDPTLYVDSARVSAYFYSTALGRMRDAVSIMSNLDESSLVIPADGFGIFTQVARNFGKEVVSGDSSHVMVKFAKDLGTDLVCEDGIETIRRGVKMFGQKVLIFLAFTWNVASHLIQMCVSSGYRILVYEKYLYYVSSSLLVEYNSSILKGTRGIKWLGIPMKLSESMKYHVDKPMLSELTKGPMYFDSEKGVRQISVYSELYPGKLVVSTQSSILSSDLYEMSQLHLFVLTPANPKVRLIRCPHNCNSETVNWDLDTWKLLSIPIDINKMILGCVSYADLRELFSVPFVSTSSAKVTSPKNRKKRVTKPIVMNRKLVSPSNFKIFMGAKYYMRSDAQLVPEVRPLFDNGKVKLVWLRLNAYTYIEDGGDNKFVRYTVSV